MKLPVLLLATALLSFSTGASAQTDCHQPLKDMLQGTLHIEGEASNSQNGTPPDAASSCTLARQPDSLATQITS